MSLAPRGRRRSRCGLALVGLLLTLGWLLSGSGPAPVGAAASTSPAALSSPARAVAGAPAPAAAPFVQGGTPAHTVAQFYPVASTPGATILVTGSGFVIGSTQVFFGGTNLIPAAGVTVVNANLLYIIVPNSSTGTANINGYLTIRVNGADVTTQNFPQAAPDPSLPSAKFPEFVLWGDATGDGTFQANDVSLARAFSLLQATPSARQNLAIDVVPARTTNGSRGDGQFTSADYSFIRAVSFGQASFCDSVCAVVPPCIQFTAPTYEVLEGNSGTTSLPVTVSRYGNQAGSASVTYQTADGTAVSPGDYQGVGATSMSFATGDISQTFNLAVVGDTTGELDETCTATLSATPVSGGPVLGTLRTATISILADDPHLQARLEGFDGNFGKAAAGLSLFAATARSYILEGVALPEQNITLTTPPGFFISLTGSEGSNFFTERPIKSYLYDGRRYCSQRIWVKFAPPNNEDTPVFVQYGGYLWHRFFISGIGVVESKVFTYGTGEKDNPVPDPRITSQPLNQTINSGQMATLTVQAAGTPDLVYQWYEGVSPDQTVQAPNSSNSATYTTPPLNSNKQYWVRVYRSGNASLYANSTTATVTVTQPTGTAPAITLQPRNVTVTTQDPQASLRVAADGTAPLSYQWYIGTPPSTTNPVTTNGTDSILTVAPQTNTTYWVRVSNGYGTAESLGAMVTFSGSTSCGPITVSPASLTGQGYVGVPFNAVTFAASGIPNTTYTYTVSSGYLPAGLTLGASTGILAGTPAPTAVGSYNFTVTATAANNCTGSQNYTLTVNACALSFGTAPANGTLGVAYSQTLTVTGGAGSSSYSLASGALPDGVTLGTNGVLSGTPTQTGTFTFAVKATDIATGCMVTSPNYAVTITCSQLITVTPATLPNGTVGMAYNQTVTASGGTAPYTFAVTSGALPQGLTLSPSGGLTGSPGTAGTSNFTITALATGGCTGSTNYSVTVDGGSGGGMGALSFSSAAVNVAENVVGGTVPVTIERPAGSSGAVSVTVTVGATSTATSNGVDYTFSSPQTVNFSATDLTQTLTIPIVNDGLGECDETIVLTLSNPTGGATLGTIQICTVTIQDDDTVDGYLQFRSRQPVPTVVAGNRAASHSVSGIPRSAPNRFSSKLAR